MRQGKGLYVDVWRRHGCSCDSSHPGRLPHVPHPPAAGGWLVGGSLTSASRQGHACARREAAGDRPGGWEGEALESPTVTALDAFGNVARGYRGTIHFVGDGEPAAYAQPQPLYAGWDRNDGFDLLPSDYTFVAADAGGILP